MTTVNSAKLNVATACFMGLIAVIGWLMMTATSSPLIKGAAFLWLPAALQMISGVWLGPVRGLIAGGLGAYLAGILAYGGWGWADIIMNPIAGGLANSLLPGLLFRLFNVKADLGSDGVRAQKGVFIVIGLLLFTLLLTFVLFFLKTGNWGYIPSLIFLIVTPLFLKDLKMDRKSFFAAILICIFSCLVSACIGFFGMEVSGLSRAGAFFSSIGWFLGDTISCFLGLVILASYTKIARQKGFV